MQEAVQNELEALGEEETRQLELDAARARLKRQDTAQRAKRKAEAAEARAAKKRCPKKRKSKKRKSASSEADPAPGEAAQQPTKRRAVDSAQAPPAVDSDPGPHVSASGRTQRRNTGKHTRTGAYDATAAAAFRSYEQRTGKRGCY